MNNTEPRTSAADLPEFLHDGEPGPEAVESADETAPGEPVDEMQPAAEAAAVDADAGETAEAQAPSCRRSRRQSVARSQPGPAGSGGGLALTCGVLCVLGGFGLGFAGDAVAATLTPFGVSPAAVALFGAVAIGIGAATRRTARLEARLAGMQAAGGDEVVDRICAALASHEPTGSAAEANTQLALLVQRQDEKLNNLTKAFKMYGKPLMEIAAHGTELSAAIAQVRTTMESGHDVARQAFARIEQQIREKADVKVALQPVHDAVGRVQVAVQAVAQRLEDSEVRKSLLRLEENAKHMAQELQQLLRGEGIERATARLSQQLDDAQQRMQTGLDQLRAGNLSGMETSIRDIQREVAAVATTVVQIQAAMKNGVRTTAAAPTMPAPQAAPTSAPAEPTAKATSAPATAPAGADATAANQTAATTDAGGYQTGKRNSTGKNVLGAIAKLKQMKN